MTCPISNSSCLPTGDSPSVASVLSSRVCKVITVNTRNRSLFNDSGTVLLPVYVVRPERSARSTFTDLTNFRLARLNGFRRVFAHAAPIFFQRGIAKPQTKVLLIALRCSIIFQYWKQIPHLRCAFVLLIWLRWALLHPFELNSELCV